MRKLRLPQRKLQLALPHPLNRNSSFTMNACIFGVATGLAILAVGRFLSKRKFLAGRSSLADFELVALFNANGHQFSERALAILVEMGKCYGIPYAKLRPEDRFKGGLAEIDSWRAGLGSMRFQHFLTTEFGSKSPINRRSITIRELFRELGV